MPARGAFALALIGLAMGLGASSANASGPPLIGATWSSAVQPDSARLGASIDPNGSFTTYHFDYTTESAYQADKAIAGHDGFTGALRSPPVSNANLGLAPLSVNRSLFGLTPATTYRYRVLATNSSGTTIASSPPHTFATPEQGGPLLPDSRGWELVSPVQKNGGQVDAPGAIADGGVLQASAGGGAFTYGSSASFAGGTGAPPASQYLASRAAGGWATQNLTAPIFSATYENLAGGVPYQIFSPDLARGLLLNGTHCRGGASGCAVANPPLSGSGAPAGYQNYYLREGGGFDALLSVADLAALDLEPADFDLRFAGTSPDLRHIVISTCAALTAAATEVPLGAGCDPAQQNLYLWSRTSGLDLLNATPGASLGSQSGAVSADGSRVYWSSGSGIHLREGSSDLTVGAGVFQIATPSGAGAFYLDPGGHLQRYDAATHASTDLTPTEAVLGVLGASASGERVYYTTPAGISLWDSGATRSVAPGATDALNYPPASGTARLSADGAQLLFLSSASLTGYDNTDLLTGTPDTEVFLFDAKGTGTLTCVSCNPTNGRPIGPSTISGALANGSAPGSTLAYKPRTLSADGRRVFFDSADSLVLTDTNTKGSSGAGVVDAYQWEALGEGSCSRPGGCVSLISSGRSVAGARFIDASADGSDAFFLTDASLVGPDPGAVDLYDARVGGGFSEPPPPIPCEGDACQALPSEPVDPTLTTLLSGKGNPPVKYHRLGKHKKKKKKRRHQEKQHQKNGNARRGSPR